MQDVIMTGIALPPAERPEQSAEEPEIIIGGEEKQEKPRNHVRAPVLRRNLALLIMTGAAVMGVVAGLLSYFSGTQELSGGFFAQSGSTFGEAFLRAAARASLFLLAEFLPGFFALGDWLVWLVPFMYAEGAVIRIGSGELRKTLPCELLCAAALIFGAARSAEMSELLLRLSRGGTVYMEENPTRAFAVSFLACFAGTVCGALLAGIAAAV